jgi:hypothetical protein
LECQLPLLLILGDSSTSSRQCARVVGSLYLYLNEPSTTWSIRFVFIFGVEFLRKVIFDHYILVGLLSVLVMDTLVEGP